MKTDENYYIVFKSVVNFIRSGTHFDWKISADSLIFSVSVLNN